jgi:hypothetical protein
MVGRISGFNLGPTVAHIPAAPMYFSASAAAEAGDVNAVQGFLDRGISIDERSVALDSAAKSGHENVVQMLLADGETRPAFTGTAVINALSKRYEGIALRIFERPNHPGQDAVALRVAAEENFFGFVIAVFAKGPMDDLDLKIAVQAARTKGNAAMADFIHSKRTSFSRCVARIGCTVQ